MFKKIKLILFSILSCSLLCSTNINTDNLVTANASTNSNIAKGADIGWVSQLEDMGISWVDDNGTTADPIKILKDKGIDSL